MDLKAKYLSETCSDPIEYLRQLRQTTEPIGGSTEYCEDGELVEYDVAIEAVRKANDAFIEKALAYLNEKFYFNNLHYAVENNTFNCMEEMFEDFKNYMKGE